MSASAGEHLTLDPIATVDARRERGAALGDPVGWCVIEGLARRAAAARGAARQWMVSRLAQLLAQHAAAESGAAHSGLAAAAATGTGSARLTALAGLGDLIDRLGRTPASTARAPSSPQPGGGRQAAASGLASPSATAAAPPLKAVAAFQGTWSRLRAEQRLRQALAQVPARAGPMNSSHVMNQALQGMRELSPAYLDAFMLHVDTLLWLEQASGGAPAARSASAVESRRRNGARASRKG